MRLLIFHLGIIVFIMIDQINELPEDGLKSSPETLRYSENKWISRKNQNKLYFLHLIDILNDLLLMMFLTFSTTPVHFSLSTRTTEFEVFFINFSISCASSFA